MRNDFDKRKEFILRSINCAQIAKIDSINTENETLNVTLYNKDIIIDNEIYKSGDEVKLWSVPFFVYSGGKASIEMPITTGDDCLIVFCDYNYNKWRKSRTIDNDTVVPHSRLYPVALVGVKASSLINGDFSVTDIVIKNGEIVKLIMSPTDINGTAENVIFTATNGPLSLTSTASTVNISGGGKTLVAAIEAALIAVRDGVDTRGDAFNGPTKAAIDSAIAEIKEVIG